ncbi:MAG: hypothetical protein MJY45_00340 [Bacteroidales bacterium]|nr:hypothetical protein [Bacteroidales bacterium]
MTMSRNGFSRILAAFVLCMVCVPSFADGGAAIGYSPYTVFAMGDILPQGASFNKGMGGTGIALRNRKFINVLNPASVTARDTLSFMVDVGLYQNNRFYRQNDKKSVNNSVNLNDLVMSFPLVSHSAMMIGVTPYSSTGFNYGSYVNNPDIVGHVGPIYNSAAYKGVISDIFVAVGATFWRRLSIGAQGTYYFGSIEKTFSQKFTNTEMASAVSNYNMNLRGFTGKFGLQYEQPVGSLSFCLGATYRLPVNLSGIISHVETVTSTSDYELGYTSDTLSAGNLKFAPELGVGLSVRSGERWRAEVNYTRSDWRATGIENYIGFASAAENAVFSASVAQSVRLGFEIIPNVNDVRYYHNKCAYRAGFYWQDEYFRFNGNKVTATGITFGITLPIAQKSNGLSLGVELGQRGALRDNMVRERYVNFTIGFSAYDIWFKKHKYQ